jgi:hypothetical protein
MSVQVNIPDEVLSILRESRVEGDKLYLPPTQLDRGLYEQVNKVLAKLGGKWKGGKVRAHIFDRDVKEVISDALSKGKFVDEKKEFQFFETPQIVAARMVKLSNLRSGLNIFEPSAGKGALASVIREQMPEGCTLYVADSNPAMRTALCDSYFKVCGFDDYDFLDYSPFFACDRIIQNPPFSNGQDAKHLLRAFELLAAGGRLVSVMSAGITFRETAVYREAASLVRDFNGSIEELPTGAFKESGTNVKAVIVTVNK